MHKLKVTLEGKEAEGLLNFRYLFFVIYFLLVNNYRVLVVCKNVNNK